MGDAAMPSELTLEGLMTPRQKSPRAWAGELVPRTEYQSPGLAENACWWCGQPRTSKRSGRFCKGLPRPLTARESAYNLKPILEYQCADAYFSWSWQRPSWQRMIMARDGWKCLYCGLTPTWLNKHGLLFPDMRALHVDHRVPVIKGGTTTEANLQTLCGSCNLAKGAK